MERVVDETGWNQKRYDIRTYTAQNERSRSWLYNKSGQEHRPGARSDRSIR